MEENMKEKEVLVAGATGATGRLTVKELLNRGHKVKAIVRDTGRMAELGEEPGLTLIEASILELSDAELAAHVEGCDAVVSCLGHNLTFRGIYGHPRYLVTEAARRLCNAVASTEPDSPVRYVLMNTTGNRNRNLKERRSFFEVCVIGLIRFLLPPQRDNEKAADFLRTEIGQEHNIIEWSAVRPDTLIDEDAVSEYEVFESLLRSAIFNPGKTSRINVARFITELLTDDVAWKQWKGQMPVIYNKEYT